MGRKTNNLTDGVKSSIALFIASAITSGISYIVTPIYTRILPEEIYGQTAVFMTWLSLLGIISMFGLSNGVFNNGMSDYPEERDGYSFSLLILSNLITGISAIFYIIFYRQIESVIGLPFRFIKLMILIFLFQPAYLFWMVRQRYEYKYKGILFWSVVIAVLSPLSAIFVISRAETSALLDARIFGAEIPIIIVYIGFYIYLMIKANFRIEIKFWKEAFLFNLPLLPHYLSIYLLNSSDKIMIAYLVGDSQTAYYSVAYSVAAVVTIVWTAINSSLIPYTYERCKEGNYLEIKKIAKPVIMLFFFTCIIVMLLAPEVVSFMGTNNYMGAVFVIPPVIGGVFFQVQYYLYANILYYFKRTKYVMYASVVSAGLNVLLNYIFIRKYGYIAAGYTTLVCFIIQAILDYVGMRKVIQEDIYDMKNIIVLSAMMILTVAITLFIYDCTIIRFLCVGLFVMLAFIKKEYLIHLYQQLRK